MERLAAASRRMNSKAAVLSTPIVFAISASKRNASSVRRNVAAFDVGFLGTTTAIIPLLYCR